jgi:hypothetical protein
MVKAHAKAVPQLAAELATAEGNKLSEEIRWLQVQTYFGANADAMTHMNCAVPPPNMPVPPPLAGGPSMETTCMAES